MAKKDITTIEQAIEAKEILSSKFIAALKKLVSENEASKKELAKAQDALAVLSMFDEDPEEVIAFYRRNKDDFEELLELREKVEELGYLEIAYDDLVSEHLKTAEALDEEKQRRIDAEWAKESAEKEEQDAKKKFNKAVAIGGAIAVAAVGLTGGLVGDHFAKEAKVKDAEGKAKVADERVDEEAAGRLVAEEDAAIARAALEEQTKAAAEAAAEAEKEKDAAAKAKEEQKAAEIAAAEEEQKKAAAEAAAAQAEQEKAAAEAAAAQAAEEKAAAEAAAAQAAEEKAAAEAAAAQTAQEKAAAEAAAAKAAEEKAAAEAAAEAAAAEAAAANALAEQKAAEAAAAEAAAEAARKELEGIKGQQQSDAQSLVPADDVSTNGDEMSAASRIDMARVEGDLIAVNANGYVSLYDQNGNFQYAKTTGVDENGNKYEIFLDANMDIVYIETSEVDVNGNTVVERTDADGNVIGEYTLASTTGAEVVEESSSTQVAVNGGGNRPNSEGRGK